MFNPDILRLNMRHNNAWKKHWMHHHHPTRIPIQKAMPQRFAASWQVYQIDSNISLGINTVSNPENLVYATLDCKHMGNDPVYKCHQDMFTYFCDTETCKLVDLDGLHPFCLASKLNADNCPSFKTIVHHSRESSTWIKSSQISGAMPQTRNFKTCSNTELSNLSVGIKYSNRVRTLFQ